MTDLPSHPDTDDSIGAEPVDEARSGTSRRAYVAGIVIAIIVVLLFVGLHLSGAIGPGGH